MKALGRFYRRKNPRFPFWSPSQARISDFAMVPYGQDKSARLDFRGSDARNPATEGDPLWVRFPRTRGDRPLQDALQAPVGRFPRTHGDRPRSAPRAARPAKALIQDFLFGRPGTNRVADPRAAIQRFSHYFPVWTPLAAAPAVECCPIAPFQQTQRAFWQNPSRADPRQPA